MCLGEDINDTETLSFNDLKLQNCKEVEVSEIILDRSVGFNTYIKNICRKAGQKLSALLRIGPCLDQGGGTFITQINDKIPV